MADPRREAAILALARAVPAGFVTSYGDLCPEAPRLAGTVLAATEDAAVPWHRIVRADGSLAKGPLQRRLLEAEGVPFEGARVRMDLAHLPREALAADAR
jgi:methylated-DNA-protein-cysteine methyltransferase-like protein